VHRVPFPWEGKPSPLDTDLKVDLTRIVALPDDHSTYGTVSGETPGARKAIEEMTQSLVEGSNGKASREWARERSVRAAIRHDRRNAR
jgi:hypothetical protein